MFKNFIEEFILRIKRRRDRIIQMEEELYLKILTQIEQRGLTIEDVFKKFDTDNNGNIEFLELLEGFKNTQIKVTKND